MSEMVECIAEGMYMSGGSERRLADANPEDRAAWLDYARSAMEAILASGHVIVSHDISNEACDAALRATGRWLEIKGDAAFVNREKMRRRWRGALVCYKTEMRKVIDVGGQTS